MATVERLLNLLQRALVAWRIASLEAELEADRETFHYLAEKLSRDRLRIALARQRFAQIGGYVPSRHLVPRGDVTWLRP